MSGGAAAKRKAVEDSGPKSVSPEVAKGDSPIADPSPAPNDAGRIAGLEQRVAGLETSLSAAEKHAADVDQKSKSELDQMREQIGRLERHLNMQTTLSVEQVEAALDADPRSEFVVTAPFRVGSVALERGQVVSGVGHSVRHLAQAGAPLMRK